VCLEDHIESLCNFHRPCQYLSSSPPCCFADPPLPNSASRNLHPVHPPVKSHMARQYAITHPCLPQDLAGNNNPSLPSPYAPLRHAMLQHLSTLFAATLRPHMPPDSVPFTSHPHLPPRSSIPIISQHIPTNGGSPPRASPPKNDPQGIATLGRGHFVVIFKSRQSRPAPRALVLFLPPQAHTLYSPHPLSNADMGQTLSHDDPHSQLWLLYNVATPG